MAGTGVHVVGTLSATDMYGLPTTTYLVDGEVASTYTAPLLPSTETLYNVTFFSALNLAPGNHTVTIENMNGTSPNMFWFDYFLIDSPSEFPAAAVVNPKLLPSTTTELPSPLASVPAKSVTPVSETSTTVAGVTISISVKSIAPVRETGTIGASVTTISTAVSETGIVGASVTISAADAAQTSTTNASNVFNPGPLPPQRSNSGAIVGGAVAGGALLAFLALTFFWLRCRRSLNLGKGTQETAPPAFSDCSQLSIRRNSRAVHVLSGPIHNSPLQSSLIIHAVLYRFQRNALHPSCCRACEPQTSFSAATRA